MKLVIKYNAVVCKVMLVAFAMVLCETLLAQDTVKRKSIDITSSFKPILRPQQKIGFTASAAASDSGRAKLVYNVPVQQLAFGFTPAPLRPMAFEADSTAVVSGPSLYIKGGYGNYSTPHLKALASFGNGVKSNGSVEGNFTSSKGSLAFQEFSQYGAKGNVWLHMKQNNSLHLFGGFQGNRTYRFGFEPKNIVPPIDSLKVRYNDVFAGADFGNSIAGDAGVSYQATLKAHFFTDNNDGQETSLHFALPVTKTISENASLTVGVKGMLSSFTGSTADFSNNLFLIPVHANIKLNENLLLKAGIIPSWNNKQFKLLPDVDLEYLLNEKNLVLQAGFRGHFDEQTFRTLTTTNPWMVQPDSLTNTRNTEVYGAVKSSISESFSFRVKAGVGKQFNVPLFVNDNKDGRTFDMIVEKQLSRVFVSGELVYQMGEKLLWSNLLQLNGFGSLDEAPKPYGLLPFELRSSLQLLIRHDLRFKTDIYTFRGAWYRDGGGNDKKGKAALDLNAGLEFDVHKKVKLWLQLNNILNMDYQRWNQYRTLGFQAVGGVIFHM
jgi:hypothetical protein